MPGGEIRNGNTPVVRSSWLNLSAVEWIAPRSITVGIMPRVRRARLVADRADVLIMPVGWVIGTMLDE